MTTEVVLALLLCVPITLCQARQSCTYYEELETEGNQNDWRGFKTVASIQRCQEFCTEISVCAAAEYSHSTGSCYLYEGPTTLRYNKDHVLMLKRCTEITTVQGTTKVEEITTSALTSLKTDVNPTITTETTTATTVTPTTTVTTSKSSTTTSTTATRPTTVSSSSPPPPPPSTTTTTTTTTTTIPTTITPLTTTRSPVTTPLKTSSNLDDIKMLMNYALTSDETRTKRAVSTERISKMVTTEKMRTTTRKKKRRLPPFLKMDMQHKRNKLSTPEYTPPTTMQARTATTFKTGKQRKLYRWTSTPKYKRPVMHFQTTYPDTSLTKSPAIQFTTPLPRQTDQVSKAIELKITDANKGLNIRADNLTTTQRNITVSVRTSSYKPPTYGQTRPRDVNRVVTPTHGRPGTSSIGRPCGGSCHYQQFMHPVFIPMVVHVPVMRPHMQSHQPSANLNPPVRIRFHGRVRFRPYLWTSPSHHYPMRTQYWSNSRSYVPYRYGAYPPQQASVAHYWQPQYRYNSRPYVPHRPGAYPPQQAPVARYWQPQYRHNRRPNVHQRYGAYPPQQYGRQSNPWENNFKRESLRAPKTHHVPVIPGKRFKSAVPRRRVYKQPYEYKPKSTTKQKPALLKKSEADVNVNDQARQQPQQSGSETKSRSSVTAENSVQNDQQWELKSHYNTYTLRLKLPMPISGYKKCFQRQQLPTPPKILVVAFKPDGSFRAMGIPVTYPRFVCVFIKPGKIYPELHLPSPLVLFTGTSFVKDPEELGKIFNATAPKAEYNVRSLQQASTMYSYISVYNKSPIFRQLKTPISFSRAKVSFNMARMGFIYKFTVRLPKALRSQNIFVEDELKPNIPFQSISPKRFVRGS